MGKDQELLEASRTGNILMIEKLLGGKPRNVLSQALSISFRRGVNPNCQDTSGYTPLHHAVLNSHRDVVAYLLRYDASATVPDSRGSTPIHLAAWTGKLEIMHTLLASGITLEQLNEQNHDWDTCLHFACQYGHTQVVEVLLEYGVDPTVFNKKEETPLDLATQYGRLEAVELLTRTLPELLLKIPDTRSLLHLGARNGHHKVVKVLLNAGCDINKKLKSGTALHEAVLFGKVEVVAELLHHQPPINVHLTDEDGETAMEKVKKHSSSVAVDIMALITAHLNGQSIPLPEQCRSPSVHGEHTNAPSMSPNSCTDSSSPYDNLQNLRMMDATSSPQNSNLKTVLQTPGQFETSSSPPNMRKPNRTPQQKNAENYMNMNIPTKVPPKKPARSSVGILLDRDSTEDLRSASPVVPSSASMFELGQSPNVQKQTQDLAPPLPERNYYDEDLAGDYTELRIDAKGPTTRVPPSESMQKQPTSMSTGNSYLPGALTETVSASPSHLHHSVSMHSSPCADSLYEDLASALSGLPRSRSAFSCVIPTYSKTERVEHNSIENQLDSPDSGECYELLSEATSGSGHSSGHSNGHKSVIASNNNSIDSSQTTTIQSGMSSSLTDQTPVPPPRKNRKNASPTVNTANISQLTNSETDSSDLPSSPTQYSPPPTPDHPPPSPHTALLGIHAKFIQQQAYPAEYRRAWSHDSGKFSPPLHYPADGHIRDSSSYEVPRTISSSSRRLGSEDSPCGTDCSSETEPLRPYDLDPFAGLIYGSNRGSRNLSLTQSLNQTTSAFTFAALEKAVANQERGEMAGENGSHDGTDSVFEAPRAVVEHKEEPNDLDENSEWAQIETIMASFGAGLVRESVYIQDFQKEFERMFDGPIKPLSVGGWLESLGVGQYENTLIANGFDNLDFMGGSILEEQDLTDMGIHDPLHRKIILDATKSLPTIKPMGPGMDYSTVPHSVSEWLRSLLLSDYIPNFIENGISAMDRARELWEVDLENVLEVHMLGHRKRILASLGDRRHSWHGNSRSSISSINQDLESSPPEDITPKQDLTLNLESSASRQKLLSTTSEQSASLDIDLFKDYSKEVASPTSRPRQNPPPISRRLSEPIDTGRRSRGDVRNGEGVVVSDKVAVHTDEEERPSYQWMHQPEVLIKGCCNYTAFYLGSSLIKEPRGTESSLEACARLRRSAAGLHKIPSITLAINYIGVKFIDSKSKIVITDHEICNISHVTQDAEDLKTFAYITKDGEHERWYCHVFTVKMVDVATEIILTLGQAFEIAYQMLLKTQSHRPSVASDYSRHDSAHDSHDSSISEDTKM